MKTFYNLLEESYQEAKKEKQDKSNKPKIYKVYKINKKTHDKKLEKQFDASIEASNYANEQNFKDNEFYYAVEKESKFNE